MREAGSRCRGSECICTKAFWILTVTQTFLVEKLTGLIVTVLDQNFSFTTTKKRISLILKIMFRKHKPECYISSSVCTGICVNLIHQKKKKTVIRGRAWGDMWCNLASAKIPDLNTSFSTCSTLTKRTGVVHLL